MKYMKRAGIYQASNYNVTFNPSKIEAWSYKWWSFVSVIEGKIVFNDYRYSNSTSKHQSKVRSLMEELGIKADLVLPVPKGLQAYSTLEEVILAAEEYLCDQIGNEVIKQQERNARARQRKLEKKLEDYLENTLHFRDYDIVSKDKFGNPSHSISTKIAVHQVVEPKTLQWDVDNAIQNFLRDGFGSVVFYV